MVDSKIKYGVYACLIWNCIVAINIVLRSFFVANPTTDLSSVEMKFFFILWSTMMFGVGYFARRDYLLKESLFIERFKTLPKDDVKALFRIDFFSKTARMFFFVAIGAIPWFIIGYWDSVSRAVTYGVCAALFIIALGLYITRMLLDRKMKDRMARINNTL